MQVVDISHITNSLVDLQGMQPMMHFGSPVNLHQRHVPSYAAWLESNVTLVNSISLTWNKEGKLRYDTSFIIQSSRPAIFTPQQMPPGKGSSYNTTLPRGVGPRNDRTSQMKACTIITQRKNLSHQLGKEIYRTHDRG